MLERMRTTHAWIHDTWHLTNENSKIRYAAHENTTRTLYIHAYKRAHEITHLLHPDHKTPTPKLSNSRTLKLDSTSLRIRTQMYSTQYRIRVPPRLSKLSMVQPGQSIRLRNEKWGKVAWSSRSLRASYRCWSSCLVSLPG